MQRTILVAVIAMWAVSSSSAVAQTHDFNACSLAPDFSVVTGGAGPLFRDPGFTNDNCASGVPDSEYYIGPGGTLLGHAGQNNVTPGGDFRLEFQYRPQLNNNSYAQILINGASNDINPASAANDGALRFRIGDESRLGDTLDPTNIGGIYWDVLGTTDGGLVDIDYEMLTGGTEMKLIIEVSGGNTLSITKQIDGVDGAPVAALVNQNIGTGMSTAAGRVTSLRFLDGPVLYDDWTLRIIPEPTAAVLLMSGLGCLMCRRRR